MEWEIEKGEMGCHACRKPFQERDEYFSAIYDRAAQFERRDFCMGCWDAVGRDELFSFWKTRVPAKEEQVKKFVDDEVILNFFMRLEDETDPLKRNFRYVLGLFLMRKKLLKFKDVARDETGEALVLHSRQEDKDYKVYIVELSDEEILHVTEEVGQILNVRL